MGRDDLPRVLFVDDQQPILQLLSIFVDQRCLVRSVSVTSALHALQELHRSRFDLLVTDLAMAGMPGDDLLRLASERWPEMRRMLITGYTTSRLIVAAQQYADDISDKVLGMPVLAEKICWLAKTKRQ